MSGTFLNVSGLIAELSSPCMERRIAKLGVARQRVVVIDVAIIGYYLITEIIGRDFVGCVYLMQRDSKLLGVAHQGDGIVCALKVVHGSERPIHSVSSGAEQSTSSMSPASLRSNTVLNLVMSSPSLGA